MEPAAGLMRLRACLWTSIIFMIISTLSDSPLFGWRWRSQAWRHTVTVADILKPPLRAAAVCRVPLPACFGFAHQRSEQRRKKKKERKKRESEREREGLREGERRRN